MNDPYDNHYVHCVSTQPHAVLIFMSNTKAQYYWKLFSWDSFIQRLVGIILVIKNSIGIEKISTNDLDRCNFIVGYVLKLDI